MWRAVRCGHRYEIMPESHRKFATILACDVVGCRLMQAEDERTLRALKDRRTIFEGLVEDYEGREFGSVGDSLMAEFSSVVNAVRRAVAIQRRIAQENAELSTWGHRSSWPGERACGSYSGRGAGGRRRRAL